MQIEKFQKKILFIETCTVIQLKRIISSISLVLDRRNILNKTAWLTCLWLIKPGKVNDCIFSYTRKCTSGIVETKAKWIDLLGREILIKEAISTRKRNPKHVNQNRWPKFVVNNFPENQDLFKWTKLVPGNKFSAKAVIECEVNPRYEEKKFLRQSQRKKTFTIEDSHLTRIKKE